MFTSLTCRYQTIKNVFLTYFHECSTNLANFDIKCHTCTFLFIKLVGNYFLLSVLPRIAQTQHPCHLYDDTADHCHNVTTTANPCTANDVTTDWANRAMWWQTKMRENFLGKWWNIKYIHWDMFSKVAKHRVIYIFNHPLPKNQLPRGGTDGVGNTPIIPHYHSTAEYIINISLFDKQSTFSFLQTILKLPFNRINIMLCDFTENLTYPYNIR